MKNPRKPRSKPLPRSGVRSRTPRPRAAAGPLEYIYGKHAVLEAAGMRRDVVREVYVAPDFGDADYLDALLATGVHPKPLNVKNPPRGISSNAPHQGVVAGIAPVRLMVDYHDFIQTLTPGAGTALLVLCEVQDPHNVGGDSERGSVWVWGVLIPPHNQAPVTGTVVKVSAGMAFRIPLVAIGNVNTAVRDLKERGFWIYGLEGGGNARSTSERFERPVAFLLGNEGEGLREKTRELCDDLLSIPMHPRCESLNAAAAAAVVMASWSAQHPEALSPAA